MAPKSKKTPPKEKEEGKVDKRRKKVVTDVRPDTVPNCPPERNLFLETLGVPSTKSTKSTKSTSLTNSQTPSPQRSQPARNARLEHGASQLYKSTKAPRFPHGQGGTLSKPVSAGQVNQQQGEKDKEAETDDDVDLWVRNAMRFGPSFISVSKQATKLPPR
jgi:hypothetical protein